MFDYYTGYVKNLNKNLVLVLENIIIEAFLQWWSE